MIIFKYECAGFHSDNDYNICEHYYDGKCRFFSGNIDCDDVISENLDSGEEGSAQCL